MKVIQLIDSLAIGGAERMAVTYANMLASEVETSYLCVSRKEGLLKNTINEEVSYLFLGKKRTLDLKAIQKLSEYIKKESITHLHAHGTSYFLGTLVKMRCRDLKLIWHNHHGASHQLKGVKLQILKWCSRYFDYVFAVNNTLKNWVSTTLKSKEVSFVPNFVSFRESNTPPIKLKGVKENRLVYLANLREPKNHLFLCRAFEQVVLHIPNAKLYLVGTDFEDAYSNELKGFIESHQLLNHIFIVGGVQNPDSYLNECAVGVIASSSEGLPMSLLEYGRAGLAVIATDVGQCAEVIKENGLLVESNNLVEMQKAILDLLQSTTKQQRLGVDFKQRVKQQFAEDKVKEDIIRIYKGLV